MNTRVLFIIILITIDTDTLIKFHSQIVMAQANLSHSNNKKLLLVSFQTFYFIIFINQLNDLNVASFLNLTETDIKCYTLIKWS